MTSDAKPTRNNAPLRYLSGVLQRKGYEVEWEQHIRTAEGLRKPDLLATMGRLALVIDAHIVGNNVDMINTRTKYSDNPRIDAAIKSKPGVVEVRHCPLIITSRRIWYHKLLHKFLGLS